MRSKPITLIFFLLTILAVLTVAGCGGSGGAKRITGLDPNGVVKTFFAAAKDNQLNEAGLYVSPSSRSSSGSTLKVIADQLGIANLSAANLLSTKQVAAQDNYAVVVATMQNAQDSMKVTVKPVGLEKIDGEWYIVDFDQIYNDAKYKVLQQLLANI